MMENVETKILVNIFDQNIGKGIQVKMTKLYDYYL